MKRCLVDVNVLLALLVPRHVHHPVVRRWFDQRAPGEIGLCRFVQLGTIRLLCNRTVLGDDLLTGPQAWSTLEILLTDERVSLIPEPPGIDPILASLLRYPAPARNLIGDAYLAAFAIAAGRRLTTFDTGFQQFSSLELELLP